MGMIWRVLMGLLGPTAVAIGLSILLAGAQTVGSLGESAFNVLSGSTTASPPWPPTMDSELRFYAALFLGFGVLCGRTALNPARHAGDVPWLMLVFFIGGLGRALSWLSVGPPHPFFLSLMTMELALPPVVILLWSMDRRRGLDG